MIRHDSTRTGVLILVLEFSHLHSSTRTHTHTGTSSSTFLTIVPVLILVLVLAPAPALARSPVLVLVFGSSYYCFLRRLCIILLVFALVLVFELLHRRHSEQSTSRSFWTTKRLHCGLVPNIPEYIVVACAGCFSLLPNASECFSDVSSWYQCTRLRFVAEMLRRGPGTRLELLTRISSIRFCFLFYTSGRMTERRISGN